MDKGIERKGKRRWIKEGERETKGKQERGKEKSPVLAPSDGVQGPGLPREFYREIFSALEISLSLSMQITCHAQPLLLDLCGNGLEPSGTWGGLDPLHSPCSILIFITVPVLC